MWLLAKTSLYETAFAKSRVIFIIFNKKNRYPSEFTKVKLRIVLKVISGQHLRHEKDIDAKTDINPQVKVSLKGSKIDEEKNLKYQTKVPSMIIKNN